jgi:hypothetical protein
MSQHPTAVVVERKRVVKDRYYSPSFNRRLPVDVQGETSPDTSTDYSAFHGVGRDITHARPHIWRFQTLAILDKLSIAAPRFLVKKVPGALVVPGTRAGVQNPTRSSIGVVAPGQQSLSTKAAVYPTNYYAPQYAKIT